MTHRISSVKVIEKNIIFVTFRNGIEVEYNVSQLYSSFPQFSILENNYRLFKQVKVDAGGYGISWNDELDLDAEEIWLSGTRTGKIYDIDINIAVAENLIDARNTIEMTQKQLAEATDMYQTDISKIENGVANPSLSTLKRLADGMNMQLKIEFIPNKK